MNGFSFMRQRELEWQWAKANGKNIWNMPLNRHELEPYSPSIMELHKQNCKLSNGGLVCECKRYLKSLKGSL